MRDDNYLWFDYTFNWTRFISGSLADTYYYCGMSFVQSVNVTRDRTSVFPSLTDWVTAFIQNMLGNVIGF